MKKSTIITSIVVLSLVAGVSYFLFSHHRQPEYAWRTARIQRGDVTTLVTATGSVSALTTVQVGAQVNGIIASIKVDFNSVVKNGQVIAILDTTFLVASRDDAAANVEKASVQLAQFKREYDRIQKLYKQDVDTRVDYDLALANVEIAKANLNSAVAQLNRAKINLQYATIRAPISGTVISRNVDVGQMVISSFNSPTLFTIANDLAKMQVQANIDEADIGQVRVGESVAFSVDAYPDEVFYGKVEQIRLQPVVLQNVVNYVVIIDVPNPDLKLMPGLTANIDVKVQEHKDVLKVPMGALHFTPPEEFKSFPDSIQNKKSEVVKSDLEGNIKLPSKNQTGVLWVVEDHSLRPETVITGISDGTFIEVGGNIKVGDLVALGLNREAAASSPTAQNPFMPKMPTRPRTR